MSDSCEVAFIARSPEFVGGEHSSELTLSMALKKKIEPLIIKEHMERLVYITYRLLSSELREAVDFCAATLFFAVLGTGRFSFSFPGRTVAFIVSNNWPQRTLTFADIIKLYYQETELRMQSLACTGWNDHNHAQPAQDINNTS